jgi:hypothetical protein
MPEPASPSAALTEPSRGISALVDAIMAVPIVCPDASPHSYGGTRCAGEHLIGRRQHLCRSCTSAVEYRDEIIKAIKREVTTP